MSASCAGEQKRPPWWSVFLPVAGADFFLLALACFLFLRPLMLLWDGGTCRHILIGLSVLTEHRIPNTNWVSAVFPQMPFIPHSLGGDVVYGLAYQLAQLNGLVLISSAAFALALVWAYQFARACGLGFLSGWLALLPVLLVCSLHWSARCQEFSYLTFLALYYAAFLGRASGARRLLLCTAILIAWVNFHGTFMLGLLMLAIAPAGDCLQAGFGKGSWSEARWGVLTLAAAALASCLNVRGAAIYSFVGHYLANPMILFKTSEFRSVDFSLGLPVWCYLGLYTLVLALWLASAVKPAARQWLLFNVLFFAGLYTMRLMPYFVLAALAAAGPPFAAWRRSLLGAPQAERGVLGRPAAALLAVEQRLETQEQALLSRPAVTVVKGALALVMAGIFLSAPSFKISDFDPQRLPVRAVSALAERGLPGAGFVLDNWGGYLYFRLRRPVFIDDWTSVYPLDFLEEYLSTLSAHPGWQRTLDRYRLDYVLIPPATLLGAALAASPDWRRVYEDPVSEIFVRASGTKPVPWQNKGSLPE